MDSFYIISLYLPILTYAFICFANANTNNKTVFNKTSIEFSIVYICIYIIIVTFGGDTQEVSDKQNYALFFEQFNSLYITDYKDIGWFYYVFFSKKLFNSVNLFFFITAIVYCGGYFLFAYRIIPNKYILYFIVVSTGLIGFYGYGVNTIRNGVSLSLFLVAITYSQIWIYLPLMILAVTFHKGSVFLLLAYIITKYIKNIDIYFFIWFVCLIASAMGFSLLRYTDFFDDVDQRLAVYANLDNGNYKTGFRIDFVIYSLVPMLLSYFWIKKYKIEDCFYQRIFCMYTFMNALWLLIIRIMYTNRFAYFSWVFIPVMLLYPSLTNQQKFRVSTFKILSIALVFMLLYIMQQLRTSL